jgi:hypothetical protein
MNWIINHWLFCTLAAAYLLFIAWFTYHLNKAPYENVGDELPNVHD